MSNVCTSSTGPCALSVQVEALEKDVEEIKALKSKDHTEIFTRLNNLEKSSATLSAYYENISAKLTEVAANVTIIKDRPTKRWDTIVTAIITGIVGFMLAKFGLS